MVKLLKGIKVAGVVLAAIVCMCDVPLQDICCLYEAYPAENECNSAENVRNEYAAESTMNENTSAECPGFGMIICQARTVSGESIRGGGGSSAAGLVKPEVDEEIAGGTGENGSGSQNSGDGTGSDSGAHTGNTADGNAGNPQDAANSSSASDGAASPEAAAGAGSSDEAANADGKNGTGADANSKTSDKAEVSEPEVTEPANPAFTDKTAPKISFVGADTNTEPVITVSDEYIVPEKTQVRLISLTTGEQTVIQGETQEDGSIKFDCGNIIEDGRYNLYVVSEDIAGNKSEDSRSFTVNRTGTTFSHDESTKKNAVDSDYTPVITVQNVDEIEIIAVTLNGEPAKYSFDGENVTLESGQLVKGCNTLTVKVKDAQGRTAQMEPWEINCKKNVSGGYEDKQIITTAKLSLFAYLAEELKDICNIDFKFPAIITIIIVVVIILRRLVKH